MWRYLICLILSLGIILTGCELFTNCMEWLGKRLKVGDGVVGSLFSAVGTCLPETVIPVAAVILPGNSKEPADISIGAIMGAPFMLGTLAFFITGLSVVIFSGRRGSVTEMFINPQTLSRDLLFFILCYSAGIAASYFSSSGARLIIACTLVLTYGIYVYLTIKKDPVAAGFVKFLYFKKSFRFKSNKIALFLQVVAALGAIFAGAAIFVESIGRVSIRFGLSAMALSLIVSPVATELPEKFNSILWIRRRKDTLALGNITGAMVFQSCLPVSFGILATPWRLNPQAVLSGLLALVSASLVYARLKIKKRLTPLVLLAGGLFYGVFLYYMISVGLK